LVGKANKAANKGKRRNKERERTQVQAKKSKTQPQIVNAQRKKWKVGCLLLHKVFLYLGFQKTKIINENKNVEYMPKLIIKNFNMSTNITKQLQHL
jgi:hypothetical protein